MVSADEERSIPFSPWGYGLGGWLTVQSKDWLAGVGQFSKDTVVTGKAGTSRAVGLPTATSRHLLAWGPCRAGLWTAPPVPRQPTLTPVTSCNCRCISAPHKAALAGRAPRAPAHGSG